jgi:hypothetical protein
MAASHGFWQWIDLELWGPIWPNLAASGITFGSGLAWARRQLLKKWEQREIEHLTRHAETHTLIKNLSDRLDRQGVCPEEPTQKADR